MCLLTWFPISKDFKFHHQVSLFLGRLAKGEAHKRQSEIGCKSGHSSCRPGGGRDDIQVVGNHLVGKQIQWWPSPKELGCLSKPPEGVIPGPIMGWSSFKCYEGMEISTCVIGKLNTIFVWEASGPLFSTIVLWPIIECLIFVISWKLWTRWNDVL